MNKKATYSLFFFVLLFLVICAPLSAGTYSLPQRVRVVPVFLVPSDIALPSQAERDKLMDHLYWAQTRFREMLHNRDTFLISHSSPVVIRVTDHTSTFFSNTAQDPVLVQRLLNYFGYNRFNNPYIFCTIVYGTSGDTGGRSLNGGLNSGGGIVLIRDSIWTAASLQTTLQHELGHAFGLSHSWTSGYGSETRYSQYSGDSIMSYNPAHYTNGLTPSSTPAILLPEDIRNLSLNKRVFPNLYFDPETDIPSGDVIYRLLALQGSMTITGQLSAQPVVYTDFGESWNSLATNLVQNSIRESNTYVSWDYLTMWGSGPVNSLGWTAVDVVFPYEVTLTGLGVHSQYLGLYYAADQVQVEYDNGSGLQYLTRQNISVDDTIAFSACKASHWRFAFHAENSYNYVIIRGLNFYTAEGEVFPQWNPIHEISYPKVTTSSGEYNSSNVTNAVYGAIRASNTSVGYDARTMWHSGPVNSMGWVGLEVEFPYPVTLDGLEIHSQHSGQYCAADQVQVEYFNGSAFTFVTRQSIYPDTEISFTRHKTKRWRFAFHSSDYVVIRGLRFISPVSIDFPEGPDYIVYKP